MNAPTIRDFRALERRIEDVEAENKRLLKSLIHLSHKGNRIDQITGEPLGAIHLHINGMGTVNPSTAAAEMCDGNEESEVSDYCIAEGVYRCLREHNLPAFGYGSEKMGERLASFHETLQNGLAQVLNLWKNCGAWDAEPWQQWHKHVPAARVLKNQCHA